MSTRFQELFRLKNDLYIEGSPIIIVAGALQKDLVTNQVLVQLKLRNISESEIIACKASISAYELNGNAVEGVSDYAYLDINILPGGEFGTKIPIYLPNNTSRTFKACITEVLFANGKIWTAEKCDWEMIPVHKQLRYVLDDAELCKQYELEVGTTCSYFPEIKQGLFLCACGAINQEFVVRCYKCKQKYETLSMKLDVEYLTRQKDCRLKQEAEAQELARKEAEMLEVRKKYEAEQRKNKRKKRIKIFVLVAIILAILAYTIPAFGVPFVKNVMAYQDAKDLLENGAYDEAKIQFENLGDFFDSTEMKMEAQYQKASSLAETHQYETAILIWESIKDYSDSTTRIETAKTDWLEYDYQCAILLMEEAKYYEAYDAFIALADYKDSKDKSKECLNLQTQVAVDAIAAKEYVTAIDILSTLQNNKYDRDVSDLYKSACYQYADQLAEEKKYEKAIEYYTYAKDYEDANDKKIEVTYLYGCHLLERSDYVNAVNAFYKCKGYKDTDKKILDAQYQYVIAHQYAGDYTTGIYLNNLTGENYLDSKKLYEEIYKWEMVVTAFNSSENSNYDMDSLSKYSKWYCHVELCGGKPGDKTKVKLVATYPDGSTVSRWWDWELVRGDTSWWCFYYNTPQYGSTGTFSIKFYDENSNLIGKDSVQITG